MIFSIPVEEEVKEIPVSKPEPVQEVISGVVSNKNITSLNLFGKKAEEAIVSMLSSEQYRNSLIYGVDIHEKLRTKFRYLLWDVITDPGQKPPTVGYVLGWKPKDSPSETWVFFGKSELPEGCSVDESYKPQVISNLIMSAAVPLMNNLLLGKDDFVSNYMVRSTSTLQEILDTFASGGM
jgi:hypothetical protein